MGRMVWKGKVSTLELDGRPGMDALRFAVFLSLFERDWPRLSDLHRMKQKHGEPKAW
jgi:hypothetical protein